MAGYENSDLHGPGLDTLATATLTRTTTVRPSDQGIDTADTMPERRASEQLWRDEYADESAPAGEDMYMEIDGTTDLRIKRLSMPLERSETLPDGSPTKRSSHKPQFKIILPPVNAIPGMSNDGRFDPSLPLNRLPILTPPEDVLQPSWGFFPNSGHHEAKAIELTPPLDVDSHKSTINSPVPSILEVEGRFDVDVMDRPDVLTTSIQLAVEKAIVPAAFTKTTRVVHQLVPSPIDETSKANSVSILSSMLEQLQPRDSDRSNWVLVTHAIPEKYPIKSITGSPAATLPGFSSANNGQDYFSVQRVIHNAVLLGDRHDPTSSHSHLSPQLPALASPPQSIDLSLYQRLIPPASAKEARDLFEAGAPSALVDRLIELVPSGRLVFVYPTSAGARTFEKDYLDKALAPVTRRIVFGKGLPAEACPTLASSGAAAALSDFETMQDQVASLLQGMAAAEGRNSRSSWSILSSGTQGITLPHAIWKQWWTMQETSRIRAVMDHYFRQVSRQHGFYRDERFTANELARQLTHDLCQRVEDAEAPPPIEVAVFVIERTS